MKIKLADCPEILQKAVEEKIVKYRQWCGECEILSATLYESTPYKDKRILSRTYRVYIMTANYFEIVKYSVSEGEHYNPGITSDSVNIGEIKEILDCAPEWTGLKEAVCFSKMAPAS